MWLRRFRPLILGGQGLVFETATSSSKGARVKVVAGKTTVTDGPFTETKELIAGFAIVQLPSMAEAIDLAKRFLSIAGDGESGLGADASGPRRFSSGDHTYRRVMLGETKSELVVRLDKLHQLTNRWGTWSGITPDGVPLFLRDISTQEIYALDLQLQ